MLLNAWNVELGKQHLHVVMTLVSVRKVDIPAYLHDSEFYKSLQNEEDDIMVPSDCMKIDDIVNNDEDLRSLLMTLRFWVAGCICDKVVEYAMGHFTDSTEEALSYFYQDFPVLAHLKYLAASKVPMESAIESGHLELIIYFLKRGHAWPKTACDLIAKVGNIEILKYALQAGCKLSKRSCEFAAGQGHVECLRYLHENGAALKTSAIAAAAEGGHLNCLIYAHQQGQPLTSNLFIDAVTKNNFDMLRYLHENGCPWDVRACQTAAACENIEFLMYLHENGCPWDKNVFNMVVNHRQITTPLYLLRNGCPPNDCIWDFIGDQFHQILQCFLETGLPWSATPDAMLRVIDSGFFQGLKCLVEKGCPWHAATTSRIAQRENNLEMMQYVHEKGCPWSSDTCVRAASLECLEYAHTHGAPLQRNTCSLQLSPHLGAPASVPLECFQYAHQHGSRLESHFIATAARMGHLPLLKYLHEQDCVMESQSALTATQHGHAKCLEYILNHGVQKQATSLLYEILVLKQAVNRALFKNFTFTSNAWVHPAAISEVAVTVWSGCGELCTSWNMWSLATVEMLYYSEMISIRKLDVPSYLQDSEFYRSLQDDEEDDAITIPSDCMKMHDTVQSNEDLRFILMTLRFWMADSICDSVLRYALSQSLGSFEHVLSEFSHDFPALQYIERIKLGAPVACSIESGAVEFVEYFLNLGHPWPVDACDIASKVGNVSMLLRAIDAGCLISEVASFHAAFNGHIHCLQTLHERGAYWDSEIIALAARGGHLDCVQYAHENGCTWPDGLCDIIAGVGNIAMLEYAIQSGCTISPLATFHAASNGHLECLMLLHQNGASWDEHITTVAGKKGHLSCLRYAHENGCPWPNEAIVIILEMGDVAMLDYAIRAGSTVSKYATVQAARGGHLNCLMLLHENGAHWDEATTTAAAEEGHIHCLQYAHENGCPWHCSADEIHDGDRFDIDRCDNICFVATANGNLDCLIYAHDQGVPLQPQLIVAAAESGTFACLAYAVEQGLHNITSNELLVALPWYAACRNELEVLHYLHELNCPWDASVCEIAARKNSLECLMYLHENGCNWNATCCKAAVEGENLECLVYLHGNGCPLDNTLCKLTERPDVALYLLQNGSAPSSNIWDFVGSDFRRILQCFVARNLPWTATPDATLRVAKAHYLDGLTALLQNGCPWHKEVTAHAAREGNLELLKFAHENGCPWSADTCQEAALAGSMECLVFAHTHGATISSDTCHKIIGYDGKNFKMSLFECFKYAQLYGYCDLFDSHTYYAARDGHIELLRFLHKQGCDWDPRAAAAAENNGHTVCAAIARCNTVYATKVL